MKKLAIIAHTPSKNTHHMATELLAGAQLSQTVNAKLRSPFQCDADFILQQDAIILFTTENFAYMSGALKDFFERIYYPCLDDEQRNTAKPVSVVIRAGLDGTGTDVAINKILTGLKWRKAQDTLICKGDYKSSFADDCKTYAQTMAAGLELGIY